MFDPEEEKKAEAARKRQKEMFARMNRGAPTLHDQMRAQAVGQSQHIADKLDRSYEMGTILGMDVHKANARRVSEGRDRQADVIRELIRANSEIEKERLRAAAASAQMEATKRLQDEQLAAQGLKKKVRVNYGRGGGWQTEYR